MANTDLLLFIKSEYKGDEDENLEYLLSSYRMQRKLLLKRKMELLSFASTIIKNGQSHNYDDYLLDSAITIRNQIQQERLNRR